MLAAVIGLNLVSRALTACLVDFFTSAPVGDNLELEAQYAQRFGQGFHKYKHQSQILLIGVYCDMLACLNNKGQFAFVGCPPVICGWRKHVEMRTMDGPSDHLLIKRLKFVRKHSRVWLGLYFKMSTIVNRFESTQDALSGVALLCGQLRAAAAWMDQQIEILHQIGSWSH